MRYAKKLVQYLPSFLHQWQLLASGLTKMVRKYILCAVLEIEYSQSDWHTLDEDREVETSCYRAM